MSYMFNVQVEGKANAVFDTADEAVDFARRHVCLSPVRFQEALDLLNRGEVFIFSCGFSAAHIVPVKKRTVNASPGAEMTTAFVDWALDVSCPECDQNNNLADDYHDPEGEIAKHIFGNEWDDLKGHTVTCQWCEHEFKLDKVEY